MHLPGKYLILLFIAIGLNLPAKAGKKLRVLFIGNSYTYVNNLPQITADIAASMGDTLSFETFTVGGYKLADHVFDAACEQKIRSGQWDYVVLQEQSQMPSRQSGFFFTNSYHWAYVLDTTIQGNNPCTNTMFYMTWGYKDGDEVNCALDTSWPYVCTYQGMDSLINLRYRFYADSTLPPLHGYPLTPGSWFSPIRPSQLSPVGAVWHYTRDNYPTIELYQPDKSHPSAAGSYAGACSFYTALFRQDPTLISYNYSLSATEAGNIRQAAKTVVYDSLLQWHIGQDDLRAAFTWAITGPYTLSFTNTSSAAVSYFWDFGDGATASTTNPSHTYTNGGNYVVRLVASDTSCSDTSYAEVTTSLTSAGELPAQSGFIISPNPAGSQLTIRTTGYPAALHLSITSALGQIVRQENISSADHRLDVTDLQPGFYFVNIITGKRVIYRGKFLKL